MKQNKKVTGLDLSEEMLKIAKQNTGRLSGTGDIRFIKADYLAHRFDEKFDAACLMGFFDYIKNPTDILLKLKEDITKEIYASFPKSGGVLAVQRKIRYRLRDCPLYLYSKKDVIRIISEAGLHEFEITDCD